MKLYLRYFIALFILIFVQQAMAQIQTNEKAEIVRKTTLNYLLWLPSVYQSDIHKEFPLLIFLHGSGERGDSLALVKKKWSTFFC